MKKTVSVLLVLVMLVGLLPAMTINVGAANAYIHRTPAEVTSMIQQYWNTVTNNGSNYRYWNNKLGRSFANNESYTTLKARVINGGTSDYLNWTTASPCPGSRSAHNSLTSSNANVCTSNWLEGTQCAGFAKYIQLVLFHTVYDESPEYFNKISGSDISGINNHTFQPGDLIRLTDEYHSVVVSKVTNTQLYFIECNANYGLFSDAQKDKANCVIRYNRSMYISTMKQNLVNDPDSYIISPNSTLRSDSTATVTLPATPTNFAAAWQNGWKALVTWSPVSDATSYEVQYRHAEKDWTSDGDYSGGTYYTSTSLGAQEWYEYRVRAVNSNGTSAWSTPLRINKTIVLNLDANGGTVSPTTHTIKYNNTAGTTNYQGSTGSIGTYGGVQNLPTPVRTGYNFDGWYMEPSFNTKVTDTSLRTRPYTNETLYAKWTEHAHSYSSTVTAPTCTANGYTTFTCSSCGNSYVGDVVVAPGHDYEAIVTEPSCTEGGYTTYTCTICGDSYVADEVGANGHDFVDGSCSVCGEADPDAVPDEDFTDESLVFATTGLSLQDYIGIQCIMQKSLAANYDRAYALIEYDDGTSEQAEPIVYAGSYYVFEVPMLSTQMCDEVTVTLCGEKDGQVYTGESTTTSVREQCMERLNNAKVTDSVKAVAADMLNYGAAVQEAFNVNAGDLANALMTDEHQSYATAETPETEATNSADGDGTTNPLQISLSLRDKVEMQFVFAKIDMSAYEASITVNGETEVIDGDDFDSYSGYPLLRIAVKAADLRDSYEITLCNKETGEQVSKNYTYSVQAMANEQLGGVYNDVVIAMMKYGDAVAAL